MGRNGPARARCCAPWPGCCHRSAARSRRRADARSFRRARRTCCCASGSPTSSRARGRSRTGVGETRWAAERDPRDLSGGDDGSRSRSSWPGRGRSAPRDRLPGRADPRDGRGAQGKPRGVARRARGRRSGGARGDPRRRVRLALRGAVVLLGDGELIAASPADEILSGGWYFATEVARDPRRRGRDHPRGRRRDRAARGDARAAAEVGSP